MWRKSVLSKFALGSVFVFCLLAAMKLQHGNYQKIATTAKPNYEEAERERQTKLNLSQLIPSFGFDNLVADSLYLEFVQYFGDREARETTGYSLVPQYFSSIAHRDPLFFDAYVSLSVANSMYAGQAEQTVDLMNQILQSVPQHSKNVHQMWTLKALDETLFLGDTAAASYSHQQAATLATQEDHFNLASTIHLNQRKAEFLATKPDTTEAQILAWKSVLPNVVKESERKAIQERIAKLKTQLPN